MLVDRAKIWVIAVAKIWCHVVRNRAEVVVIINASVDRFVRPRGRTGHLCICVATHGTLEGEKYTLASIQRGINEVGNSERTWMDIPNLALVRIHLLKRMTLELNVIQRLSWVSRALLDMP
jgi:hypothetical protein